MHIAEPPCAFVFVLQTHWILISQFRFIFRLGAFVSSILQLQAMSRKLETMQQNVYWHFPSHVNIYMSRIHSYKGHLESLTRHSEIRINNSSNFFSFCILTSHELSTIDVIFHLISISDIRSVRLTLHSPIPSYNNETKVQKQ